MTPSSRIASVAQLVAAAMIFGLTLEVSARVQDWFAYGAPFIGAYKASNLRGTECGVPCNIPDRRFEKWRNNNLGFRGEDFSKSKPEHVKRIVCLGASETYGLYESPGKEWPAQLQELMGREGYQVVNASVVGMGVTHYKDHIGKHILPLDPDLLVLSVNPIFYAVRAHRGGGTPPAAGPQADKGSRLSINDLRVIPKLKEAVKKVVGQYFPEEYRQYQMKKLVAELRDIEAGKLKGKRPIDSVPKAYQEQYAAEVSNLLDFCNKEGIPVVLTTYPSLIDRVNIDRFPEILLDGRRFSVEYSLVGMHDVMSRFNAAMVEAAHGKKTPVVDLEAALPKTKEYFGDTVHYTDRGARVVAEKVADEIRRVFAGAAFHPGEAR